jgi:hypothetical protein
MKNGVESDPISVALNEHGDQQNVATTWGMEEMDQSSGTPAFTGAAARQRQLQNSSNRSSINSVSSCSNRSSGCNNSLNRAEAATTISSGAAVPVEDRHIRVCTRNRSLNKREVRRKEGSVISVPSKGQIVVHELRLKVYLRKFL